LAGLQVHQLDKTLGERKIVDRVSFAIAEGEFFVLLGPSGGGKTTILRLICGLEAPDSGSILIDDRDVTTLPARERNVGMVFQEYGLYPNMDVYHNIAYGLEARGTPKGEVKVRVTQAAEVLGLSTMLKQSVVDLSGGEQQRVALARALAKDASVYLYDEPLSNLDPKLRHRTRHHITDIHHRKRKPSLYVTHDQGEALAMADRIGVMANGRLQQVGTPEQLLDEPANLFVAGFIGSPPMNLIPGTLTVEQGDYRVVADGVRLPLPREWKPALAGYDNRAVVLGIRPDGLALCSDGQTDGRTVGQDGKGAIAAEVEEVDALIGETTVTFRVPGGERLVGVFAEGAEDLATGQTVRLGVRAGGVRLFDPESERSLRVG
jgi:multiple sugar transport system ATP-binding protein